MDFSAQPAVLKMDISHTRCRRATAPFCHQADQFVDAEEIRAIADAADREYNLANAAAH
jgi:hypothetical protein